MQHAFLSFAAFVAVALGLADVARAAERKPPQSPLQGKLTRGAGADTSDASTLYAEAEELYQKGDLHGSAQKLRECYEKTHNVNLLFNLAQLYRELADCTAALAHYQRYVDQAHEGGRVPDAKRYINELSKECPVEEPPQQPHAKPTEIASSKESTTQAATTTPNPVAPPPPLAAQRQNPPVVERQTPWATIGWCAFGAGVALGGASVYFVASALEAHKDTETASEVKDYVERSSDLSRDNALAVTFAVGSAAALGLAAYSLLYAAPKERQRSSAAVTAWSLGWTPAGPAFMYRGRF